MVFVLEPRPQISHYVYANIPQSERAKITTTFGPVANV